MIPHTARKTAGTSRASNTVLTADADLVVAVEANAVYELEGVFFYDSPVAADFKFAFTAPAAASGSFIYSTITSGSAAGAYADDQNGASTLTGTVTTGGGAAIKETIKIQGSFSTSSAGNLTLTWAQNTSNASNTTLQTDSYIKVTRIG
jgi:hypothetical protein